MITQVKLGDTIFVQVGENSYRSVTLTDAVVFKRSKSFKRKKQSEFGVKNRILSLNLNAFVKGHWSTKAPVDRLHCREQVVQLIKELGNNISPKNIEHLKRVNLDMEAV